MNMNSQKLRTILKKIETLGFHPNRFCSRLDDDCWVFSPEKAMKADTGLYSEISSATISFKDMLIDDLNEFKLDRDNRCFLTKHGLTVHKAKDCRYVELTYKVSEVHKFRIML